MVSTTGLSPVDYLVTEALADPPGSDVYYSEKLVRLTRANAYMPPDSSGDPGPVPCNGGTTSLDALWMRVPVVTMAGETFMSCQGLTFLGLLDLDDLIATGGQSYIDAARRLAGDTQRLTALRRGLRQQVESRLIDPSGHVEDLERAYDEMWRRHVAHESPAAFSVTNGEIGK